MDSLRIQAKFLIVSPSRVLHPAQMVVRHGRVMELTQSTAARPDLDLGDSVLMPGLLNAHTHLEFSSLEQPFPAGASFPEWIAQVLRYRWECETAVTHLPESADSPLVAAIQAGLAESFASGSVLVGDIVSRPWQPSWLAGVEANCRFAVKTVAALKFPDLPQWNEHLRPLSVPQVIAFPELVGLTVQRIGESCNWAASLAGLNSEPLLCGLGISPHAPYSTNLPAAREFLATISQDKPLAMHLAESRDELEWLAHGSGAFREAYERLGIPVDLPRPSIEECLAILSQHRSLLIHGNYLSPSQIVQIAASPNISVVYCPRTHSHFGHEAYPLDSFRKARVRVVLGTDSRASNPDLSLWDEVVHVRQRQAGISDEELLSSVTDSSAVALGLERDWGTLDVGKWASAIVFPAAADWTATNLLSRLTRTPAKQLAMCPLGCVGHEQGHRT